MRTRMDLVRSLEHLHKLNTWVVDPRVLAKLEGTGFENFVKITQSRHHMGLLSAMVDCYSIEDRCFIFNNSRVVITLEDVVYITGLPVDGRPVTGVDLDSAALLKYLGYEVSESKTGEVAFNWLMEKFMEVPEGINEKALDVYVRAYLLFVMGCAIFPSQRSNKVSLIYLSLMHNLDELKLYAWGAAMLADLHVSLEKCKRSVSSDLSGPTSLMAIFALERIPTLRSRIFNRVVDLPSSFPLFVGWTELLSPVFNDNFHRMSNIEIANIFQDLEEGEIQWQPYKRLPSSFLPEGCANQVKLGRSCTALICFEKVVYHRPDLSPKQFGIQVMNTTRLPSHNLQTVPKVRSRSGRKGTDFSQHADFVPFINMWTTRASHLIENAVEDYTSSSSGARYQAAEWLRQMDGGALEVLPKEPSEGDFCLALRTGLILCNVLNKVNPGAVHKVVENPIEDVQSTEGAIQYFENIQNFLVAVSQMKLLSFEASDLEKGGSLSKVVDCILCLKAYYEWKQAGGTGVWRYGGTVRITSPSSVGLESADESESSRYEQLLESRHISSEVTYEESKEADMLTFLFDHFGLELLQSFLTEGNETEDFSLNSMVIDTVLGKVVKVFSKLLVSQSNQLGLLLKKMLEKDGLPISRSEFMKAISEYLGQRTSMASSDFSKFCSCGGKHEGSSSNIGHSGGDAEVLDFQQTQLEELKSSLQETQLEVQQARSNWEEELQRLEHHFKGLEVASSSLSKVLEENRLLYNEVQDLKGAIRVYCRVRPLLGDSDEQSIIEYVREDGHIRIADPYKHGKDAKREFAFKKVFTANTTQKQIYVDTQPLIRSVLDGFNVCIFAYGQTGSGKTYTMSGPNLTTEEAWGVNYRALHDLFQISTARADITEYEIGVQMIEIYNEQVRDQLVSDRSSKSLDIRNNSQLNGLNVPGARLVPVKCIRDIVDLMTTGQGNRAVGVTALNERSSRSHSILTVHVRGKEKVSGSMLKGRLHLVDLAGSESVEKSGAVGERLKEAQHINRSLCALGDVISALAQNRPHIPYRNSKLTQLLQDSLGGHAKTAMFVHINPEVNAIGETLSTLKFAERVASVELGAARSNKQVVKSKMLGSGQ